MDSTTVNEVDHDPNPRFNEACRSLLTIVEARQRLDLPPAELVDTWWNASDDEIVDALGTAGRLPFRVRRQLSFLHAHRCALDAAETPDRETLSSGVASLINGLWHVSRDENEEPDAAEAALAAASLLVGLSTAPRRNSVKADARRHGIEQSTTYPALLNSVGLTWDEFNSHRRALSRGLRASIDPSFGPPPRTSAADSLMYLAEKASDDATPRTYDTSGRDRRVEYISLSGFRGSPQDLELDLTKSQKAVSALILGDNGTGKSTIVDAIEFCLQGRIGRSVSFSSPLGPAAASMASDSTPEAMVMLDDESVVQRVLTDRGDGTMVSSGDPIHPGFRLAPVTLKRQDILRFLDTDALSRGHVFFDYFPADADALAVRPEEELQMLDDEAYELRIERSRLAAEIGTLLPPQNRSFDTKDALLAALRDHALNGQTVHEARRNGDWERIEPHLRNTAEALLSVQQRLTRIKKQRTEGVQTLNPVKYRERAALLGAALDGIGEVLTEAFRRISNAAHVERIDVLFGRSGPVALDVVVELKGGRRCFPQQIFSEGYRDLLAILFFVVVARRAAEHGQARVLILDDVFQSVDATVRHGTIDYLLTEMPDWQLIVTVHDRLWFEQLRGLFRRHGHQFVERELQRWTFDGGIELAAATRALTSALERQMRAADPSGICGSAGRLLEQTCDALSWRLGVSVTRRREDRYTLGDLWPSIHKALRRTDIAALCAAVDQTHGLRNITGAHYNEWAESLTLSEAEQFGNAVLALVGATWCEDCHDWISRSGPVIRCRGGHLELT